MAVRSDLEVTALRVREHVLRMAGQGGCFVGSAFSCVEILTYLHCRVLAANKSESGGSFILSKGHAVPALYGLMVELQRLPPAQLATHMKVGSNCYWHPNRALPGVVFHTGSLGHGLCIATGLAIDNQLRGTDERIFCLIGDGELNEGSNWEALLVAAARSLEQLVVIVDRNGFQANFPTERLTPLEPLHDKLQAFGCSVYDADGHDFHSLQSCVNQALAPTGKPTAIIAHTTRGKGIRRIEGDWEQWFVQIPPNEVERWVGELYRNSTQ